SMEELAFSIQEVAFAMLTEVTERAMAHLDNGEVLLGGGVARNQRLQEMVGTMAKDRGATMFVPPGDLCIDNGAMIAWTGLQMYRGGVRMTVADTIVNQRYRTDEVAVTVFDANLGSGNSWRPRPSTVALAASASRVVRAIRFSIPSSLSIRRASRNARKSGTAGV